MAISGSLFMKMHYRLGLVILILISCIACDQATKNVAKKNLVNSPPISLLQGVIQVEYTENAGAMLSLGANFSNEIRFVLFVIIVGLTLSLTLFFTFKSSSLSGVQLSGLALISAGGIGNLIDRVRYHGMVTDFVSIGIGPLRTAIFNLADVAIFAGVFVFLIYSLKERASHSS